MVPTNLRRTGELRLKGTCRGSKIEFCRIKKALFQIEVEANVVWSATLRAGGLLGISPLSPSPCGCLEMVFQSASSLQKSKQLGREPTRTVKDKPSTCKGSLSCSADCGHRRRCCRWGILLNASEQRRLLPALHLSPSIIRQPPQEDSVCHSMTATIRQSHLGNRWGPHASLTLLPEVFLKAQRATLLHSFRSSSSNLVRSVKF